MKVVGMIPVRMESTRLSRKAIQDICGLPMIIHTLVRTKMSKSLDAVYVVTDNQEISSLVQKYNGKVILTSKKHKTGSDRLAEAAVKVDADIIVNIQGDEALVNPDHIEKGVLGVTNTDCNVSLLLTKYSKRNSFSDIKAALNKDNEILYLSRADIPFSMKACLPMFKAYHVVTFKRDFLIQYSKMPQSSLEKIESNEYLRILENGHKIQGVLVTSESVSVDTVEDLAFVREQMAIDPLFNLYKNLAIIKPS